jgi:hypothetical protein
MNDLIRKSFGVEVKRCNIKRDTSRDKFILKILEEYNEASFENDKLKMFKYITGKDNDITPLKDEVVDIARTAINFVTFLGYDFVKEFEACIIKNENRCK